MKIHHDRTRALESMWRPRRPHLPKRTRILRDRIHGGASPRQPSPRRHRPKREHPEGPRVDGKLVSDWGKTCGAIFSIVRASRHSRLRFLLRLWWEVIPEIGSFFSNAGMSGSDTAVCSCLARAFPGLPFSNRIEKPWRSPALSKGPFSLDL